ncbi:MAG TPA: amidase family protein [Pirellulaceae bacterium]|nr:amidase family protein [Pirellulaceae bacterium]
MQRRELLKLLTGFGIGSPVFASHLAALADERPIDRATIEQAERLAGLELTDEQRDAVAEAASRRVAQRQPLGALDLGPDDAPAFVFKVADGDPAPTPPTDRRAQPLEVAIDARPADDELAFLSVAELGALLRAGKVTSVELTRLAIERLKKYDPILHCVVTLCETTALERAAQADRELAAGTDRGALHGIPWGAKDLIAVPGYPTTWGAPQFREQQFETAATVAKRLDDAGAVLVAKLSLGALAMGDQWFGGMTRAPWDVARGSSGSSAGSASAVAAGLVPFALGSETLGSIVSPSRRCGTVGLRPTFGRVSRAGCMPLSWTMDKIGPICRSAQDTMLVLAAIHGADGIDRTAVDRPLEWPPSIDFASLKVGVVRTRRRDDDSEPRALRDEGAIAAILEDLGATLIEIELPEELPVWAMVHLLEIEAAAMFHDLTERGDDEGLNAWGGIFRAARFTSAVEYVQMMRARSRLQTRMETLMSTVDLYVSQTDVGHTNLTGHPSIVLPTGLRARGDERPMPTTETLTGRLFDEARLVAVAHAVERKLDFRRLRPPLDEQLVAE